MTTSGFDSIRRLLGEGVMSDDPRSLLGLGAGPISDEAVIAALRDRVQRLADHPESNTLEADEVRLALHAAAARLLETDTPADAAPARAMPAFEASIARVLAATGGWNRESMRRLSMLAKAQGVEGEALVRHLTLLSHGGEAATGRSPTPGTEHPREPETTALPEQRDPVVGLLRPMVLMIGLGAVVLVVLAWGLAGLLRPAVPPSPATVPGATAGGAESRDGPRELFPAPPANVTVAKPRIVDPASGGRVGDFTDLIRAVGVASRGVAIDPEAAFAQFEAAHAMMSREWPRAGPEAVIAGQSAVLEFLYAASSDSARGVRAVDLIAAGSRVMNRREPLAADEVGPAAWSCGVLTRLLRERDLPSLVRDRVRDRFTAAFGDLGGPQDASFQSGVKAVLAVMPPRLLLPPTPYDAEDAKRAAAGWEAWIATVEAVDSAEGRLREALVVQALEGLLLEAPEPIASRPVFDAVAQLTAALRWRAGDESRRALLRWFTMPSVSSIDLQAVTSTLATKTAAEGVDYTMVLSLAGGDAARTELRDRYAAVWGLSRTASRSELLERWLGRAEAAEATGDDPPRTPAASLAAAVTMARLNEAAAMLWAGETAGVQEILDLGAMTPPEPNTSIGNRPGLGLPEAGPTTTTWAVRYLAVGQAIPPRREILSQVGQVLTPMEADILASEAVRGAPVQVRQDARALVQKFSAHPAVVNALLELAPTMPATRENTELIRLVTGQPVPVPRDPGWRVAVRRALVGRLLDVLADQAEFGFMETASADLAESYRGRLLRPGQRRDRGDGTAPAVEVSAGAYRERLRLEAEGLLVTTPMHTALGELDARRLARGRIATGRVQEFAVEQLGAVELLAYIVGAERPGASREIAACLRALDESRRSARHVYEQVHAAERAMLVLWRLRAGGTPS